MIIDRHTKLSRALINSLRNSPNLNQLEKSIQDSFKFHVAHFSNATLVEFVMEKERNITGESKATKCRYKRP